MRRPKATDVKKFGGVDELGNAALEHNYDVKSLEVKSDTNLEEDQGHGAAAIIRTFEFGVNPQAFAQYKPTKQELFNSHYKGIELALWKDGMKVMPDVEPKIVMKEDKYFIMVGAQPMRGHTLQEKPKTLKDLIHG